ncbi:threonine synthase, partial [Aureobasidium melanogenum]
VPTGNFGDILAGYFAKRMGLPVDKLVIATNENDILHRFWRSGHYEKKPVHGREAEGGFEHDGAKAHLDGVKETLAPAMDILVSSNFERLLWYLSYRVNDSGSVTERRKAAGEQVKTWLQALKTDGGFGVEKAILDAAHEDFESERVSDKQTLEQITQTYASGNGMTPVGENSGAYATQGTVHQGKYILDPHSAIGIAAALRSVQRAPNAHHIALATAHPAKFSSAVETALGGQEGFSFKAVQPEQFVGLEQQPRRVTIVKNGAGWQDVREIVREEVQLEMEGKASSGPGEIVKG